MSQLFTAVYDVNSSAEGQPTLRLSLVVDGHTESIVGHAQLDPATGDGAAIRVHGHHLALGGDRSLQAIVLAGTPVVSSPKPADPSAFQLLMVLPTAWKDGQVCYKMSFGKDHPRNLDVRDGVARAVLPEACC